MWSLKKTQLQTNKTYFRWNKNLLPTQALNKHGGAMSDVMIISFCRPVSFATTRGMFPDHFMKWPGARGGPCHSYRGFYLSQVRTCAACRPRVPRRLDAGISEILPPNGWRWLASYRKSRFIVISPGFVPWPEIENGCDTGRTSWPPGPRPSPLTDTGDLRVFF